MKRNNNIRSIHLMGYAAPGLGITQGPRSLRRRPKPDQHISQKNRLRPSRKNFVRVVNYLNNTYPAKNSCERVRVCFSVGFVDMLGVICGETADSLRNPETRCTSSYIDTNRKLLRHLNILIQLNSTRKIQKNILVVSRGIA